MHKMCLLLLWKSERRKNNCYLVFGDKNDVFLFSKKIWYLTRLAFAQEAHASLKEPQNNRNYSRSENVLIKAEYIELKQCIEPCVSCFYLTYCMEYVWKSSLWIPDLLQRAIQRPRKLLTDNIQSVGNCSVNYYYFIKTSIIIDIILEIYEHCEWHIIMLLLRVQSIKADFLDHSSHLEAIEMNNP